jgi:hypothetical protein
MSCLHVVRLTATPAGQQHTARASMSRQAKLVVTLEFTQLIASFADRL